MNTKKKILFLVTQSEFGGAQRFIYRLITNLDLSKYDISIAAGPEGNNADGLLFSLRDKGFKVLPLKFLKRVINPVVDFCGFSEIYRLIKKEKPDTVFLCSTKAGFLGSLAAALISKSYILNPRIIYRIGGWTFNDPWPKWKKKLYIWLEKNTAKFKDFIINNAESDRQQAIRLGIKPKKEILTIYNGIDTGSLRFLPSDEARSFLEGKIQSSLSKNQFTPRTTPLDAGAKRRCKGDLKAVIGTIANLYPCKGLEYLIEAANLIFKSSNFEPRTPNMKFVIIGDGEEREKLEYLIKKHNLEEKIILTGAMPDAWKYLKAFDIFILPSIKEGFPWTILEAMAAGIPVIATNVGAVPEIIENNENGILIEPRDPKIIAESIEKLINNKDLIEKFSQNGKKTVIEKFNLQEMIKKYEELFI